MTQHLAPANALGVLIRSFLPRTASGLRTLGAMPESIHGPQRASGSEGSALEKGQAGGGPRTSVGVGRETERHERERQRD